MGASQAGLQAARGQPPPVQRHCHRDATEPRVSSGVPRSSPRTSPELALTKPCPDAEPSNRCASPTLHLFAVTPALLLPDPSSFKLILVLYLSPLLPVPSSFILILILYSSPPPRHLVPILLTCPPHPLSFLQAHVDGGSRLTLASPIRCLGAAYCVVRLH